MDKEIEDILKIVEDHYDKHEWKFKGTTPYDMAEGYKLGVASRKISKFNQKRIKDWLYLTEKWHEADDHAMCPRCKEQFIQCGCVVELAQDILESLLYRKVSIPESFSWRQKHGKG